MKFFTSLMIFYIINSIYSHNSSLFLGFFTKDKTNKNQKIYLNLSFPYISKTSFGIYQKYQDCNSENFSATNASLNKEMKLQFTLTVNFKCKKSKKNHFKLLTKNIEWNFENLEKIFKGEDFDNSQFVINGKNVGVSGIEGIEGADFEKWRDSVKKGLEAKGVYKSHERNAFSEDSDESYESEFWPVFNATYDTVIGEEFII